MPALVPPSEGGVAGPSVAQAANQSGPQTATTAHREVHGDANADADELRASAAFPSDAFTRAELSERPPTRNLGEHALQAVTFRLPRDEGQPRARYRAASARLRGSGSLRATSSKTGRSAGRSPQ